MRKILLFITVIIATSLSATDIISIYNNNNSLVESTLNLNLKKGIYDYYWDNVPETIDASSIIFSGKDFEVLLEKFENPSKSIFNILSNYVGKEIELTLSHNEKLSGILSKVNIGNNNFISLESRSDGTNILVSYNNIVSYSLPKLTKDIPINPHIFFRIRSKKAKSINNKIFYSCSGIKWSAISNALINDKNTLTFDTFAKIDNHSGKSFKKSKIKLISGKVNKVYRGNNREDITFSNMAMTVSRKDNEKFSQNPEHSFENYHIYNITEPVDLSNNQVQIIPIIKKKNVHFTKELRFYTNSSSVNKFIIINNTKKDGLGISIPAGVVSFYKKDTDGKLISIGEDNSKNWAINQKSEFKIGDDFDVSASTTILENKIIGKKRLKHYQVKLINGSKEEKKIIVCHYGGINSKIWDNNIKYKMKKANLYTFEINLKPKGNITLDWQQSNIY